MQRWIIYFDFDQFSLLGTNNINEFKKLTTLYAGKSLQADNNPFFLLNMYM